MTLKIKGTKCGKCARRIESVISKVDGVNKVVVSHKKKRAKVIYKKGAVSIEKLEKPSLKRDTSRVSLKLKKRKILNPPRCSALRRPPRGSDKDH